MSKRRSRDQLYRMALMYDNGSSKPQIMAAFRCSKDTVDKALALFKVKPRPAAGYAPRVSDQQVLNLRDNLGWSFSAIAKHFGMSRSSISWRYRQWYKKKNATPTG